MHFSKDFFPHLHAAKEQALNRDVERLRVRRERAVPMPTFGSRVKRWSASLASEFRRRLVQAARPRETNCVEFLEQ